MISLEIRAGLGGGDRSGGDSAAFYRRRLTSGLDEEEFAIFLTKIVNTCCWAVWISWKRETRENVNLSIKTFSFSCLSYFANPVTDLWIQFKYSRSTGPASHQNALVARRNAIHFSSKHTRGTPNEKTTSIVYNFNMWRWSSLMPLRKTIWKRVFCGLSSRNLLNATQSSVVVLMFLRACLLNLMVLRQTDRRSGEIPQPQG